MPKRAFRSRRLKRSPVLHDGAPLWPIVALHVILLAAIVALYYIFR
jgi:hypothetical protein